MPGFREKFEIFERWAGRFHLAERIIELGVAAVFAYLALDQRLPPVLIALIAFAAFVLMLAAVYLVQRLCDRWGIGPRKGEKVGPILLMVVGALLIVAGGLWYRASGKDHATPAPPSPPQASVPPPPVPSERKFANRTPSQLLAFFKTLTPLQADKLIEPYKGLWIDIETHVINVLPDTLPDHTYGYFRDADGSEIECRFSPQWIKEVSRLAPGDAVKVRGKINQVTKTDVFLTECEII